MTDFKSAFGQNLKILRKSKNMTQEKLAELIDIYPRQLSKIENGDHFPSTKTLENLCIALNVQPKDLFNFEINYNKNSNIEFDSQQNLLRLIDKFKTISKHDNYTNFIILAIDAVHNKKALYKLQDMLDGIRLVTDQKT